MKMPGIQRMQVQSLGRQNSDLARQVAAAKTGVTNAVVNTVTNVVDTVQKEIIEPAYEREAVSQYSSGEAARALTMAETEATLNNPTGMVDTELIPHGVTYNRTDANGNPRLKIPTHEVAKEWYRHDLKKTQKDALASMSNAKAIRKMKSEYSGSFADNYLSVMTRAQGRKQEDDFAGLVRSAEMFVEAGDQKSAERIWLGAMKVGSASAKVGNEKLMAIPGEIDSYKVSRTIHTSGLEQMDTITDYIYRDFNRDAEGEIIRNADGTLQQNPMSFDQRLNLINQLETRRTHLTTADAKGTEENSSRILNQHLIDLQDMVDPMTREALTDTAYSMSASDHRILVVANRALHKTDTFQSDNEIIGALQADINDLVLPQPPNTISQRRAGMIEDINTALLSGYLTSSDAWSLIQRVNTAEEMPFKNPDIDFVRDQIYMRITKGAKSNIGLSTDAISVINAANAEDELYRAARDAGPEFDALKWMDSNLPRHVTKNALRNETSLVRELARPYMVINSTGGTDIPATEAALAQGIRTGAVTQEVQLEVVRRINIAKKTVADSVAAAEAKANKAFWDIF